MKFMGFSKSTAFGGLDPVHYFVINFNLKTPVNSSIEHQVEERELSDYWLANNNAH